jgi:hypothetical protein
MNLPKRTHFWTKLLVEGTTLDPLVNAQYAHQPKMLCKKKGNTNGFK